MAEKDAYKELMDDILKTIVSTYDFKEKDIFVNNKILEEIKIKQNYLQDVLDDRKIITTTGIRYFTGEELNTIFTNILILKNTLKDLCLLRYSQLNDSDEKEG